MQFNVINDFLELFSKFSRLFFPGRSYNENILSIEAQTF